jgi:hypothetical protein
LALPILHLEDVYQERNVKRFLRLWPAVAGWSGLAIYISWNAYWLCNGRLAPSLLRSLAGIPAPTTGGTRAIRCLLCGDWRESLRYNALAVPIAILLLATVAALVLRFVRHKPLLLPNSWFALWAIVLIFAWICKLCGDPLYW